ncbi:MAG: peptidoglycan-binding protein, partial [Alphaproteobacteria bacterium]|nr:peptidoglycan-binding protein [Alphaproteobacteria bacterium]
SRDMIKEMQGLLGAQGYRVGTPDGVVGPLTRSAIRAFQKTKRLPADGFPSTDLLDQLRGG